MSDDRSAEVLDFLRERFARMDARLDQLREELGGEVGKLRREVEAEIAVLRTRQDQHDVFARGVASFMVELQAALTRIERKLDGGTE